MGDHQPCTSDHSRQLFVSHQIGADQHCQKCGARWPCDFTQARMQRDALRTALTAAQATIAQRDAQVAALTEHMRLVREQEAESRRGREDRIIALTDELIAATDRGNAWQTVAADLTERLRQEGEKLAARDAQVAELTAALQAVMRRIDRTGKACWCPPIFDDRVFHTSDCLQARAALAASPPAPAVEARDE